MTVRWETEQEPSEHVAVEIPSPESNCSGNVTRRVPPDYREC